jgi:hypothetical protein
MKTTYDSARISNINSYIFMGEKTMSNISRRGVWIQAGRSGFYSRQCKIFIFAASRPALRLTQSPIQWVPGAASSGLKRQGREADHAPPFSAEVKNGGAIHPLLHMSSCVVLNKCSVDSKGF